MIKRGICTIEQLKKGNLKGLWGDDKFVAIDIYSEIINNPEYKDLQEAVLMSMQDKRGAYKRTYQKRFESFDANIEDILKPVFSAKDEVNILDLGVSDGRTAKDFYTRLKPYLPEKYSYYATDYSPYIKIVKQGRMRIILDGWNNPIQIIYPPFVLNMAVSRNILLYPINLITLVLMKKFAVKSIVKQYESGKIKAEEISLFDIDTQEIAQENEGFQLVQYSVLEPVAFDKKFNVIRAMNLFNESYFTDAEFQIAFNNLKEAIQDNGYLIIGSNHDADTIVDGNIFQKTQDGFKEIYKSGKGVPLKNITALLKLL